MLLWLRTVLAFFLAALIAAQAAIHIQVVRGDGAVHRPGSRVSSAVVVEVRDEIGRPLPGAAVSFQLPLEGASGVFTNGLNTTMATTGADGRAATPAVRWNRIPGPVQVRVTAGHGQSRAGTLVDQVLSADQAAVSPGNSRSRRKWMAVGLLLATAGTVGFVAGRSGGTKSASSGPNTPAQVQIGTPTIIIGRP